MTFLIGIYFTHCINSSWFASVVDAPPVEVWKSPLWLVSVKPNGEWGTTWTPWTPSRALLWLTILVWVMSSPQKMQINLSTSKKLLALVGRRMLSSSQQYCIENRILVLIHKIWNLYVCSFSFQPQANLTRIQLRWPSTFLLYLICHDQN